MDSEFEERFRGRYFGKYRAWVTNRSDPKELCRILLKCPAVLGTEEELGWALPSPAAGGGVNTGDVNIPQINDIVWVEFEEGDPSRPLWAPGMWTIRDGENTVPKHGRAQPDTTDYARREYGNVPPSQFEGTYGNNRIIGDVAGNFLELDATSGAERVQLSHRTGTRIEMQSDGGFQEVVGQSAVRQIGGKHSVEVIGQEEWYVGGERTVTVEGSVTEEYKGKDFNQSFKNRSSSGRSVTETLSGSFSQTVGGTWDLKTISQMGIQAGGQLSVNAAQNMRLYASENMEIIGSNANGQISLPPVLNSVLIHGYNGKTVVQASDITGEIFVPRIEMDGITGFLDLFGGVLESGQIELGVSPGGWNVFLGGTSLTAGTEAVIKGTTFLSSLSTLTIGLQTFLTAMAGDAGLATVAPTTVAAATALNIIVGTFIGQLTNFPSLKVFTA